MSQRQCDLCKQKPASIHYTEIADSRISKMFLCHGCAESKGLLDEPTPEFEGVEELISTISKPQSTEAAKEQGCRVCGMTFQEFQQQGKLGCPECYTVFRDRLVPLLRRIHQFERHTGKTSRSEPTHWSAAVELSELKKKLEQAVHTEDYELAARLRDQIHLLEARQGHDEDQESNESGPGGKGHRDPGGKSP